MIYSVGNPDKAHAAIAPSTQLLCQLVMIQDSAVLELRLTDCVAMSICQCAETLRLRKQVSFADNGQLITVTGRKPQ